MHSGEKREREREAERGGGREEIEYRDSRWEHRTHQEHQKADAEA